MSAGTIRLVSGDTAGTPPVGNVHIYSKLDKKLYYKDDTGTERLLGNSNNFETAFQLEHVVEYITLTDEYINSAQIKLANLPAEASDVSMDIIGNGSQVYASDYTVYGDTVSWLGLSPQLVLSPGDVIRIIYAHKKNTLQSQEYMIEYITLDQEHILSRTINLINLPNQPQEVTLDIISGGAQVYSVDYAVENNALSWENTQLETILTVGDSCRIAYMYSLPQ